MLTIYCISCKTKVFKYLKKGKGSVLKCYKSRINKDYSITEMGYVYCKNGHLIGIDMVNYIKMKQNAFNYSGTILKK
jgi:hypothetical protein